MREAYSKEVIFLKPWQRLTILFIAVGFLTFLIAYFLGGMEVGSAILLTLAIVVVTAGYSAISLSNVKKVDPNSDETGPND